MLFHLNYAYCGFTHQSVKLAQVAAGVSYLHSQGIVHADIRGVSIPHQLIQNYAEADTSLVVQYSDQRRW
jgi:hypothetical protein